MAKGSPVWVELYHWDEAASSETDAERRGNRQYIRYLFESKGFKFRWEHSFYVGHRVIEVQVRDSNDARKAARIAKEASGFTSPQDTYRSIMEQVRKARSYERE